MIYAASEIIFWILLAAIVGGGIGYGLSEAKSLRIRQRLSQSKADAPMERELAIAWDTIEDLNRRLQVAHETIRAETAATTDAEPHDADDDEDADPEAEARDAAGGNGSEGAVGTRLSQRVASASMRNRNVEPAD